MPGGPANRPAPQRPQVPGPPSESETRRIPLRDVPQEPPTVHGSRPLRPPQGQPPPGRPPQPPGRPPQGQPPGRPPQGRPPQPPGLPPNIRAQQPGPPPPQPAAPPQQEAATTRLPTFSQPEDTPPAKKRGLLRRRKWSIAVILGVVVAVVVAALVGGELYARHEASSRVANAVQCEVQDSAAVSFATAPPVLWQFLTKHYPDIAVQTAGNQVRSVKGMKVSIDIRNIRLNQANNSAGTIESLKGTITWSTDGIKQSIQDAIPTIGSLVTGEVTTNPGESTVSLKGLLDSATVKPQIVNNGLSLQVVSLTALGSTMSTDSVQKSLDELTSKANNYPLGIHADSVKVTDSGVEASFSTNNATIPAGGGSQDSCFANF
ncbi:hypothetical protein BN1232_04217 [Mycobacterium lentiflavum]|uniref:DUF2993 domain-containing protein n=2 Tax=Mycobacterium lentiflavum TaxID=141349 RepID=A0A0E3WD77_MYCLN|nr:hypothetical protein BN1232_04217 [Mycobacterium lentiflavum]